MAAKAEAGKALGKVTNSIKENLEKTEEERQANRHELQKTIPCSAGGWVTAEHWLGTFTINGIDWHDTEEHVMYLVSLTDARKTAEAYNTPNDYACPVALHLTYLKMCSVHRTDVHDLRGDAISDKERKALANVEQGHNQQICWDLIQLAKALKKTGGTVTVPTLGSVTSKDCLELAHFKGLLSLKQLNGGETDLHSASLQAALGATKKNIAQVLEEQGSDNTKVTPIITTGKLWKLQSSEGEIFEVESEAVDMSEILKILVAEDVSGTDDVIPLPNVKSDVLRKVIVYCKYHSGNPPGEIPKPLKSPSLMECGVSKWDSEFINEDLLEDLSVLINAADYLHIASLLDLACSKAASVLIATNTQESLSRKKALLLTLNSNICQQILTMVKEFEAGVIVKLRSPKVQEFVECVVRDLGDTMWAGLTPLTKWRRVQSAMNGHVGCSFETKKLRSNAPYIASKRFFMFDRMSGQASEFNMFITRKGSNSGGRGLAPMEDRKFDLSLKCLDERDERNDPRRSEMCFKLSTDTRLIVNNFADNSVVDFGKIDYKDIRQSDTSFFVHIWVSDPWSDEEVN